ncbi:GDP-mannose 4,6-dehydratase, partial [bacterium]
IGTGEAHSVREFATIAFKEAGFDIEWEGEGMDERGIDRKTGKTLVIVSKKFFRPAEVNHLLADPSKAMAKLGWKPRVSFQQLVSMMVKADIERCEKIISN